MNKKFIGIIFLLLTQASFLRGWQETRTPLSLFEGYMHYPLDRDRDLNDCNLDAHFWTGLYWRNANRAFGNDCTNNVSCSAGNQTTIITTTHGQITLPNACCVSCEPTHKESLGSLYFGKSTFTFEQAFAQSFIPHGSAINPFVILTPVALTIDYREQGVWFGLNLSGRFGCNKQWNTGVRIRAPYRDIKVEPLCGNPITNASAITSIGNLFQQRVESIQVDSSAPVTQNVFVARVDALEVLNRVNFNVSGAEVPMVTYPTTDILIAGQNASGGVPAAGSVTNLAPFLGVIESSNGTIPSSVRWADTPSNSTTVVNGDGSGLANLQRGRIASDISYALLSADKSAQSQLYVVPNAQDTGSSTPGALIGNANSVYTALTSAFNNLASTSLTDFVDQVGLNACYGNTSGFGDLNFEFFLAHDWKEWGYLEGRLWIMAPTGVKVKNPLNILQFPTGNNGHPEIGLGIAGGIEKLRYLAFNFDAYYIWVTPANNNVAAPFAGATVKNIGPCVPGKTSWHYGIIDINMNIINPHFEKIGVMIGYQAYLKSRDKLRLCQNSTLDWAGNLEQLNACVYEKDSDRVANRIRTETFYNSEWASVFLGFEATVSGKNIPKEVDFHVGLDVHF
ncbi:MAG: hypothetical protein K2X90_02485 [Candidatus Babeliaceae bacterium]|nr:hypothetical protein [Candidatus Babeliaceae bacterium]